LPLHFIVAQKTHFSGVAILARFDNGSMGPPIRHEAQPRRHHYVPQCWLAGFTETGENDGRLWVTDFSRQRQWPTTPANAGHIRDFYRLSDPAPDPVAVERFFSRLEGMVAPVLRALDTERRPPSDDELDLLLHFIAYQWVRVPRFRPFVLGVLERFTRQRMTEELRTPETWRAGLIEAGMDPDAPGADYESVRRFLESGEYSITAETDWYLQRAFSDIDGLVEILRRRYWGTSITQQGRLIASDNPVVMEGERGQMIGFANAELIIYAVSRHVLLTGTLVRVAAPMNFNYFASMNTLTLLSVDAQAYSHIADFPWMDENRHSQTDWQRFSKDRF